MKRHVGGRGADGFTTIEVLVVTAILGIIVLPLTAAIIVGLKTTDRTASVLVSSADRQFVTIHLTPDLESASGTPDTAAATATGCAGASPGANVLRLQWREFDGTSVTSFSASYRVVADGTGWDLVRYGCTTGGTAQVTTVAHALQSASAATATIAGNKVSLAVTDKLGAQYTVSGTRRTP